MKILLTGGSGKLGTELQKIIKCYAPNRKTLDITNPHSFLDFYGRRDIETVIHAAAYTDVPKCEINRRGAIDINIIGTKNVATNFLKTRIVYISTDYVYSGKGNHKETEQPEPFNFYGFTKLAGEEFMDINKDLIIRTSFKPSKWEYERAFNDIFTSADYIDVIAKDIAMLAESNLTGIINVGTERKTIYDLAHKRNAHVKEMSKNEIKNVKLPFDISMNLDKLNNVKKKMEER